MEKIIEIDGKQVGFKTNGLVPVFYKAQFKRDLIKDLLGMGVNSQKATNGTEEEQMEWLRDNVDFMMFYDIAWVFARAYDKTILPQEEWLETFEVFPIMDIFEPLQELLEATISTKKKPKKAAKTTK